MLQVREITPDFLGQASEMLPGFGHQTLLTSVAMTEPSRGANTSHTLFGIDPIIVLAALISCFCVTSFFSLNTDWYVKNLFAIVALLHHGAEAG